MSETNSPQEIKKDKIGKYFFRVAICIEALLIALLAIVIFFHNAFGVKLSLFSIMGISIIILWIAVLIAYYAWAIYFYNINLGLTDHDWEQIAISKNTENPMEERDENPHSVESLGLPPGTVRGAIAITLLVGALAMTLVLFGEGSRLKDNEIFVDNFDFFKTAFLMMIAFYFGQKSLEYLLPKKEKESLAQSVQTRLNPLLLRTPHQNPKPKLISTAMGLKAKIIIIPIIALLLISCKDKRYFTVSKVKDAAKLATSETIIDKIVIGNEEKKLLRIITIGRARFVCYTQAVVKAGIDLKKIEEEDIEINGKQISLNLPPVQVINFSYPFDKFKVDRILQDDDLFARIDIKDMEELFRQSEIDIRNLLPYTGIVEATEQKTTQLLEMLLRSLGYKEIYITYRKGELLPKINPKEIQ